MRRVAKVLIDLAINPFDAEVPSMVEFAAAAEERAVAGVWVLDHFSGAVADRRWSRDPFVCLTAIANATERIDLGVLVANMRNRHPAQLASAVNSLQSLAPERVRLGVGSGAVPGSRFAVEHEAIGTDLETADERRVVLADTIGALRAIWAGRASFDGRAQSGFPGFRDLAGVVDGSAPPPIIVGASAWPTIELAAEHADGVNVRWSARAPDLIGRVRELRPADFEVSVHDDLDAFVESRFGIDELAALGVDRLILGVEVPHTVDRLDALSVG
jgi:alkanesulfonate monooxygenase SsuD/methylene tetrahydromethanopterin reductase-like flavin-dependent oxidoreductase (luciferase family)